MKRLLAVCVAIGLCFVFASCGNSTNTNLDGFGDNTTTLPTQPPTQPPKQESIEFISDRRTQYDDATKQHIVFFGLQTENGTYVDAAGYANIVIKDKSGYVIYDKEIQFTSADFTSWTNSSWDSSRYMCGLYINQDDIEGSASESGELILRVTLSDGTWFNDYTMTVYDLPPVQLSITVPELPAVYTDQAYSYTNTVSVNKLEYTTTTSYDGTARVEFTVLLKLEEKSKRQNESDRVHVGYKLYDSEGVVVGSGQILSDPIAVGESSRETFTIYDLDPRETYVLKFLDVG